MRRIANKNASFLLLLSTLIKSKAPYEKKRKTLVFYFDRSLVLNT